MATNEVFHARDVQIKLLSTGTTVENDDVFSTVFAAATDVLKAKEVSVKRGDRDFTQQNYHGTDSESYQNQGKIRAPQDAGEIAITIDSDDYSTIAALVYDSSVAAGGTHTTYVDGNATRREVHILVDGDDGTDQVSFVGRCAELTSTEDKTTGADGVLEKTLTFKMLAKDTLGPQFKD